MVLEMSAYVSSNGYDLFRMIYMYDDSDTLQVAKNEAKRPQIVDELVTHYIYVVRRCGRLAPRQLLSVCALLPAYEGNRHLRPLGNLGHHLRRPRWID